VVDGAATVSADAPVTLDADGGLTRPRRRRRLNKQGLLVYQGDSIVKWGCGPRRRLVLVLGPMHVSVM